MFEKITKLLAKLSEKHSQNVTIKIYPDGYWEINTSVQGHVLYEGDGDDELTALYDAESGID